MERGARAAGAALCLAAGLWLWALRPAPASGAGCPLPAEIAAAAGHSREVGCAGGAPLRGPARLLFGQRLDLDTVDAASLEVLPGIGPARAAAIVTERERRRFESLEALRRVRGIGPRGVEALRPFLAAPPRAFRRPAGAG